MSGTAEIVSSFHVSRVRLTASSPEMVRTGHLGYLRLVLNDTVAIDGISLRRALDGRFTLSFPTRRDQRGRQHFVVRPIDDAARRDFERQVFAALNLKHEVVT
jgi:hypothetical protein